MSKLTIEVIEDGRPVNPSREPVSGDWIRVTNGKSRREYEYQEPTPAVEEDAIILTVTLGKDIAQVGEPVNYTIEFSEPITVPGIVPISVSDRNGMHVTNIGTEIRAGVASGTFIMDRAGDFTVTEEAINFHKGRIPRKLKLGNLVWLRVYQGII